MVKPSPINNKVPVEMLFSRGVLTSIAVKLKAKIAERKKVKIK